MRAGKGAWGGAAVGRWWPVHSRGLFERLARDEEPHSFDIRIPYNFSLLDGPGWTCWLRLMVVSSLRQHACSLVSWDC